MTGAFYGVVWEIYEVVEVGEVKCSNEVSLVIMMRCIVVLRFVSSIEEHPIWIRRVRSRRECCF